jgi:hypothetical protein
MFLAYLFTVLSTKSCVSSQQMLKGLFRWVYVIIWQYESELDSKALG